MISNADDMIINAWIYLKMMRKIKFSLDMDSGPL